MLINNHSKLLFMKLLFTILICFICLFSYCQTPAIEWQKSYGGSAFDGDDTHQGFFQAYQTSGSGSIVVGATYSTDGYANDNHGGEDILVLKLNAKGKVIWHICLGGSSRDYPTGIQQTFDGGYIVSGATFSNDGNVSGNHGGQGEDAWVVKLNSKGEIEWQRCYGGTKLDYAFGGIKQTRDSGYIVACSTNSNDGDINGGFRDSPDYWIIKLDNQGAIKWQNTYGGSYAEEPKSIEQTYDGGYIAIGYTNSINSDVSGFHGGVDDAWIIKLDSAGNLLWQKCVGGSLRDEGEAIKQTKDSGYIAAITARSVDGDVVGNHGQEDYMLARFNKLGNLSWTKCLGGSNFDQVHGLQILNGYYIMTGASNSNDGDVSGNHGDFDYWTVKTDTIGNIIWQISLGGTGDDEGFSIDYKPNSGYLIGGESNSKPGGDYDFLTIKLEDDNILPVTLFNFNAQRQNSTALLKWQTANEINNNYFNIKRSVNPKLFSSIGRKQGLNNDGISNYSFTDSTPLKGINYYRLRQVDKDGKYSYSGIASVEFLNDGSVFAIAPNPANSFINVIIPSSNAVSEIIIYNVVGKKLLHEQIAANITSKQININHLSTGIYDVVLIQNGTKKMMKLVKK